MSGQRLPTGKATQQGAALLAAMLIVTLVASFAASALWQQWRGVEVEAAERSRVQAAWLLTGALDWSRLILREDARTGTVDHLAEPWAIPLQEARLSSFLAADKNSDNDAQNAFLSGQISDLQSRLNVFNLTDGDKVSEPAFKAFVKLFELLGLAPTELSLLIRNLRLAYDSRANSQADPLTPLPPQRIEQLVWLGLSPQTVQRLAPYITLLPERTPVNLNTASASVIYASIPEFQMGDAQRLVSVRARAHFRTLGDAGPLAAALPDQLSVASRFFEVRGRLRQENTTLEERSWVRRDGQEVKTLWRERGVVNDLMTAHSSSLQ